MKLKNRLNITCCNKCENRRPGCHSVCDIYLNQKKELNAANDLVSDNKRAANTYIAGPKRRGSKDRFKPTKERQR